MRGPSGTRPARWIAGSLVAGALLSGSLAAPPSAAALGTGQWSCAPHDGSFYGSSYRTSFSQGGGFTRALLSCRRAGVVGLQLTYRMYPGGPLAVTGPTYSSSFTSRIQDGTIRGRHFGANLTGNT